MIEEAVFWFTMPFVFAFALVFEPKVERVDCPPGFGIQAVREGSYECRTFIGPDAPSCAGDVPCPDMSAHHVDVIIRVKASCGAGRRLIVDDRNGTGALCAPYCTNGLVPDVRGGRAYGCRRAR
jgi:hypothetical protein